MPELPEVQTVVTTLRPRILGWRVAGVQLNRTDILTPPTADFPTLLAGRTVADITRRAKRILFTLDNAQRFYIHLGMTGQLTAEPPDLPLKPHTHLILTLTPPPASDSSFQTSDFKLQTSLQLRFRDPRRFGGIFILSPDDNLDAELGPEPLTLGTPQLITALARTKRAIKSALLDQRLIAGLGNIYVDESLHAAGIHPLARADRLSPESIQRLNSAIKKILRRAIRLKGSSISDYVDANGSSGRAQNKHAVYARESKPCRTCDTPIHRIVLGGRSTHFCPRCQPRRQSTAQ